jgi:hypothetical protein
LQLCPYALLTPLFDRALRADERKHAPADVPLRALIPTMHYDAQFVRETSQGLERFSALSAPVLLLGGSKSPRFLAQTLDVLTPRLAHATPVELPRVGHRASADGEQPGLVAAGVARVLPGGPTRPRISRAALSTWGVASEQRGGSRLERVRNIPPEPLAQSARAVNIRA